ncbi:MAG: aldo/keto reductase, partial [Sphaerochaetaceae bacterium]|nr:aldo/keto reductase [Sphaerochaetaceae bacterium]
MLDALKLERYLGAMQIYLGTWQISSSDGFWTDQSISQSEAVLTYAIKSGLTCFDTAQSYGKGQAQQTLSKILRRYPTKTFTVDTKIMPSSKPVIDLIKPSLNLFDKIGINCLYLHWPQKAFDNVDFVKQICALKDKNII